MTCSDDYKEIIKKYSENPSEPISKKSLWLAVVLVISLSVAMMLAWFGDIGPLRVITLWELIALATTLLFSVLYFMDLRSQIRKNKFKLDETIVGLGALEPINYLAIIGAAASLLVCELAEIHVMFYLYLALVALSFGIFVRQDYLFAHKSTIFRKVRNYWAFLLFVDLPAMLAFAFLLVYAGVTYLVGAESNKDVLSGAVVMQMLIADTLYVVIMTNYHNWLLANRLCDGVTEVGDPE